MFLALHFECFIWRNHITIKWGRSKHQYLYANVSQDFFSFFFFKKNFLKKSIIPYSHFALCMYKHCWEAARPGWLSILAASMRRKWLFEKMLLLAADSCFFFQVSDGCLSSLLRWTSISGEWRTSQGGQEHFSLSQHRRMREGWWWCTFQWHQNLAPTSFPLLHNPVLHYCWCTVNLQTRFPIFQ